MPWPYPSITADQALEALNCVVDAEHARYTPKMSIEALLSRGKPNDECEWATLAYAIQAEYGLDDVGSEMAMDAYAQAVTKNPAYALRDIIFYAFFGTVPLVEAPPIASEAPADVLITYASNTQLGRVSYKLRIRNADTNPQVSVSELHGPPPPSPLPALTPNDVRQLTAALTELVPIPRTFALQPCDDNYPDWTMRLSYRNGHTLDLETNHSNMLFFGGPWQTTIDGVDYIQASSNLSDAIRSLVEYLGLPIGWPSATVCSPQPFLADLFLEPQ